MKAVRIPGLGIGLLADPETMLELALPLAMDELFTATAESVKITSKIVRTWKTGKLSEEVQKHYDFKKLEAFMKTQLEALRLMAVVIKPKDEEEQNMYDQMLVTLDDFIKGCSGENDGQASG